MTRKDIKKGTGYVMLFSVACTVIIFSLAFVKQLRADRKEAREKTATPTYWSDRLTNKHSEHAPAAKMDAIIQNFINRWDIKGLSLAVTRNDSLLYAKGYGWADREREVRMEPRSIMRLASASKLVTAVAIMKLAENKKLSLDSRSSVRTVFSTTPSSPTL